MPLTKVGDSVGLPKLPFPGADADSAAWDAYGRQDVEIIRRVCHAWFAFVRAHDLGAFAHTLAGQALNAFRTTFQAHEILIDDDEEALALARSAYHGGRVEAFRIGRIEGPVNVLDVNSMYPFVMRDRDFPTVLRLHARRPTLDEVTAWLREHCVVARCVVRTSSPRYAHFDGRKLLFPTGRFVASLTTVDLVAALQAGEVVEIQEASAYDRAPIFRGFVERLYRLRLDAIEAGDPVASWLLKILMNSLYGKFGQSGRVWEEVDRTPDLSIRVWDEIDAETGERYAWRQFAGVVQRLAKEPEASESHPAIAAHVTAYARSYLWDLVQVAGLDECYYCDTDSLFTSARGLERLAEKTSAATLGALKLEGIFPHAVIHGLKDYELGATSKTKGARKNARWLSPNTVVQDQWSTLRGLIRDNQLSAPVVKQVVKTFRRVYDKGQVMPDGRVLPFTLGS